MHFSTQACGFTIISYSQIHRLLSLMNSFKWYSCFYDIISFELWETPWAAKASAVTVDHFWSINMLPSIRSLMWTTSEMHFCLHTIMHEPDLLFQKAFPWLCQTLRSRSKTFPSIFCSRIIIIIILKVINSILVQVTSYFNSFQPSLFKVSATTFYLYLQLLLTTFYPSLQIGYFGWNINTSVYLLKKLTLENDMPTRDKIRNLC